MGVLALHLFGESASRDLLVACLCHDLGENLPGDVTYQAKKDPEFKAIVDRLEAGHLKAMQMTFTLSPEDQRRLKYLDRLDAFLWAFHNTPHILGGNGWPEDAAWLADECKELFP